MISNYIFELKDRRKLRRDLEYDEGVINSIYKDHLGYPTFGIGLRFAGYGFDFGYTSGEPDHPLANTMRFSLNMEF